MGGWVDGMDRWVGGWMGELTTSSAERLRDTLTECGANGSSTDAGLPRHKSNTGGQAVQHPCMHARLLLATAVPAAPHRAACATIHPPSQQQPGRIYMPDVLLRALSMPKMLLCTGHGPQS